MNRSFAAVMTVVCLAVSPHAVPVSSAQHLMSKLKWRSIGPSIGGRVVAVAGVPSEPNFFYMGAVEGGIWRSANYGQTWENISDRKLPRDAYSIGAIAVAPSDPRIIYAGSGENDIRGDFATGVGVFKTTDAGSTWHYAGLRETHMTSSIVIDPRNPNVVYATSMGHVFRPNPARGVFKTTDGGKTWRKILYVDDRTGANTIVMDPHHPGVLYAAMWQAQRTPWNLTSGGPGSGLYKTPDAGAHWKKISSNPGFATGLLGKIGVAVAASDPRVVYAIVQAHQGGVYRSRDGGATWTYVNAEWKLRQRAFYYTAIYVDPTNPNTVFVPQVDAVWKSTNGGKTWKELTPSGDHHIVWINPRNPKIILEGDDGGATVSVDGGDTWSTENNQTTGQFYHITLDNQFPFHVYGAQQDEGAFEGPSASNEGLSLGQWHTVALGESTFIAVHPRDPNVTFGAGYYSSLARLDTPTGEEKNVSPYPLYLSGASAGEQEYRFGWTHPILFSPANPDELFETAQVVFKSDDFGQTWNVISPDLTRNDKSTEGPSGGPIDHDQTGAEIFPDIASFAVSPLNADVMWAGSADGLVHVTVDDGTNWKLATPPELPQWAQISSIEPSRVDAGTVYLSASRYMWDDFHPYIYKTTDYGAHWTQITSGLPDDEFVFVVRQDPRDRRVLFAGTRSSVFVSLDGGEHWQSLTLNLPGVQVRDLAIDARQGELAAATHGRGFWILDNLALLEQLADGRRGMLFAPETAWLSHAYGKPALTSPLPDSGENPAYGATVFFNIPSDYNGKTPVTLSFLDSSGKLVRSFALHLRNRHGPEPSGSEIDAMDAVHQMQHRLDELTAIDPGMNAFQWDLRYSPATEVRGLHLATTDDYSDAMNGPTVLPGTYTAVLDYGGKQTERTFDVELDPRLHPAAGDLEERLDLAMRISSTLDMLNRTINDAMAARAKMPAQKRAQLDAVVGKLVQFKMASSEGDTLNELGLRDELAFLMNELDLAYQAPTTAESSTYDRLRTGADTAVAALQQLLH
jgi:photosystem II stability/assembly factor-like uncharacterized protein